MRWISGSRRVVGGPAQRPDLSIQKAVEMMYDNKACIRWAKSTKPRCCGSERHPSRGVTWRVCAADGRRGNECQTESSWEAELIRDSRELPAAVKKGVRARSRNSFSDNSDSESQRGHAE